MPRYAVVALSLSLMLGHTLPGVAAEGDAQSAVRAPRTESTVARPALNAPMETNESAAADAPLELNASTLLVLSLAVVGLHLARRSGQTRR